MSATAAGDLRCPLRVRLLCFLSPGPGRLDFSAVREVSPCLRHALGVPGATRGPVFLCHPRQGTDNGEPKDNLENWPETFSTHPVNFRLYRRDLCAQALKPNDTSSPK